MLLNLVSNAVKFTEQGSVSVQVTAVAEPPAASATAGAAADPTGAAAPGRPDREPARLLVRFAVSDTGPGIPESLQTRLFCKFSQADSSITRRYGGTGLGLAICRELLGLMGGEIGVNSQAGHGATFWFELPLARAAGSPMLSRSLLAERLRGVRALIIDDSPVNIEILRRQLRGFGMHIDATDDGFQAVAELERAWFEGRPYDLVLLDQLMPGLAGLALAERVRAIPSIAETRLVLISSLGCAESRKAVGRVLDAVLEKPIRRADLLDCLARLFGADAASAAAATEAGGAAVGAGPGGGAAGQASPRRLRVLLAEDNQVNQHVVLAMLRKAGHEVRVVGNGVEAVDAARAEAFDVVLMDVQMPVMDGIEATRQIRALPGSLGRVPVLALTADAMTGAKEYYLQAGMDDYLAKPIRAATLLAKLVALAATAPVGDGVDGDRVGGDAVGGDGVGGHAANLGAA